MNLPLTITGNILSGLPTATAAKLAGSPLVTAFSTLVGASAAQNSRVAFAPSEAGNSTTNSLSDDVTVSTPDAQPQLAVLAEPTGLIGAATPLPAPAPVASNSSGLKKLALGVLQEMAAGPQQTAQNTVAAPTQQTILETLPQPAQISLVEVTADFVAPNGSEAAIPFRTPGPEFTAPAASSIVAQPMAILIDPDGNAAPIIAQGKAISSAQIATSLAPTSDAATPLVPTLGIATPLPQVTQSRDAGTTSAAPITVSTPSAIASTAAATAAPVAPPNAPIAQIALPPALQQPTPVTANAAPIPAPVGTPANIQSIPALLPAAPNFAAPSRIAPASPPSAGFSPAPAPNVSTPSPLLVPTPAPTISPVTAPLIQSAPPVETVSASAQGAMTQQNPNIIAGALTPVLTQPTPVTANAAPIAAPVGTPANAQSSPALLPAAPNFAAPSRIAPASPPSAGFSLAPAPNVSTPSPLLVPTPAPTIPAATAPLIQSAPPVETVSASAQGVMTQQNSNLIAGALTPVLTQATIPRVATSGAKTTPDAATAQPQISTKTITSPLSVVLGMQLPEGVPAPDLTPPQIKSVPVGPAAPTAPTAAPTSSSPEPSEAMRAEFALQTLPEVAAAAKATAPDQTTPKAAPRPFAEALMTQVKSIEVSEGRTSVSLHPRGLGAIEVEVVGDKDATSKVIVRVENAGVLQALRDDRDLLAHTLGIADSSLFEFHEHSAGGQSGGETDQNGQGNGALESAATAAAPQHQDVVADDQLDILT
ncbi:hypothetical protein SAMN04488523_11179 [Sulfitobacter brevis]|uniref:Hook-length control protein FliK n=1 Tax=Sulfitobacter brevis TaxID=74348 RepID=A0A1I2E0K2_9RHOB|nr:hypothetical protein [Sulfitobacter brevis]SFE86414.1 hypothetical protein SAMN04488523_11179 [Sulfitobacter brevis]